MWLKSVQDLDGKTSTVGTEVEVAGTIRTALWRSSALPGEHPFLLPRPLCVMP